MSITGKLGEELIASGYVTTAETLKRFESDALSEATLTTWIARGHVESIKVGKFLWIKLGDVEKRVADLPANKLKRMTRPPAMPDAPQRVLTKDDVKEAFREVMRELGLIS